MSRPPLSIQLYTLRDRLREDPVATLAQIANLGIAAVEPVCIGGMDEQASALLNGIALNPVELKSILDDHGLVVSSTHAALPDPHNANAVLDEQELLGSDLLIVSALNVVPGCTIHDFDAPDTLKRAADRFNQAAALAAQRGIRIGYHNHYWEWNTSYDGRPGYEVFFSHLDPSIIAEVDIYWARLANRDPAELIRSLGPRAELVHVKDGPLVLGEAMTPLGTGKVDVDRALRSGNYLRWHIIEFDDCDTDIVTAVATSAAWLINHDLSTGRPPATTTPQRPE